MFSKIDYLALTVKLILILSILNSIHFELWHIMSANIFLLILTFAPQILKKSSKIKFPREFEFLILGFVVFTLFLGNLKGIIAPMLFGLGTGLIGLLILFILYSSNQIKKNYSLILLFSFNFAVAFGVVLELLKYYLKLILGQNLDQGVYIFTMMNLSYVVLGALIACIFGLIYMKTHFGILHRALKKFKRLNKNLFHHNSSVEELNDLIKQGENSKIEFKSTLRRNLHTNEIDKKIEHSNLKTIGAFMNSNGGVLLIGVEDKGKILGIERDKFADKDKFLLHFNNLIKQNIGKRYLSLIYSEFILVEEKNVLKVECKKSKKPVFLKQGKEEEFYVRAGPSTTKLNGSELLDYVKRRFEEK